MPIKKVVYFSVTLILIAMLGAFFMSYGTWEMIGQELPWTKAYDSLGDSMKHLEFNVAPETIMWEGLDIDGKKYIYFGPFPAFIRMVLNYFWPENYGSWSRVSTMIALCLMTIISFITFSIALKNNTNINIRKYSALPVILTFGLILGTPVFYLTACTRIYSEAIMWGVSFAVISLSFYYLLLNETVCSKKLLALFGISISCTLLSRITFALPLYVLCLYLFYRVYKQKEEWFKKWMILGVSAGIGGVFQLFYNFKRFGNIFITYPVKMHYLWQVKAYGFFSAQRLYDGLLTTLIPNKDNFSLNFPYIMQKTHEYKNAYLYGDWKEPYTAITLTSIFFTFLIIYFACREVIKVCKLSKKQVRIRNMFNAQMGTAVFLSLEALLICSCHFITQRYMSEYVPLIFFLTLMFITKVKSTKTVKLFSVFLFTSCVVSMLATISEIMFFLESGYGRQWVHVWQNMKDIIGLA